MNVAQRSTLGALLREVIRQDCQCDMYANPVRKCGRCWVLGHAYHDFPTEYAEALHAVKGIHPL